MNDYRITRYHPEQYRQVSDLLFYSRHVQTHLDWHATDIWINSANAITRLAWQDDQLIGLLSAGKPTDHTAWVRLVGIAADCPPVPVLQALWQDLTTELRQRAITQVAWLLVERWQDQYIAELGFEHLEDIITLRRSGDNLPDHRLPSGLYLRRAEEVDVPRMTAVDHIAFEPPWQNTEHDIRQARRIAAISRVAMLDQDIVGFQISTRYQKNGHLARLAVLLETQGRGVATALLSDLIRTFLQRRIHTVTVNTQASNQRSLELYQRFGFQRNGYDLPVWYKQL